MQIRERDGRDEQVETIDEVGRQQPSRQPRAPLDEEAGHAAAPQRGELRAERVALLHLHAPAAHARDAGRIGAGARQQQRGNLSGCPREL